ncbi:hypothetical protein GWK47_041933 [Chionoecetes opilio]|uniref:Uncharacterized protein n=1 Tax=Chionoecetes opilio TaxID=41210 RepID=A0A8J4YAQ2_CHIOP|nr:hypothetical protein GWK47_041933 [Chionoecetes opilio]
MKKNMKNKNKKKTKKKKTAKKKNKKKMNKRRNKKKKNKKKTKKKKIKEKKNKKKKKKKKTKKKKTAKKKNKKKMNKKKNEKKMHKKKNKKKKNKKKKTKKKKNKKKIKKKKKRKKRKRRSRRRRKKRIRIRRRSVKLVNFAPEKSQAMVVSRSPAAGPAVEGRLRFGGVPLPLQGAVKVLGVKVDRDLRFDGHTKHIAKKASHRVSALRRVARFLDRGGKLLLYKAQIRPYLEYAALSWMSCAASHTRRLDSIQRRVLRLVDTADPPDPPDPSAQFEPVSSLDTLEHRRDVAALVVFHKAQVQGVPHLAELRHPPRVATRSTRTVLTSGDAVEVPRSRASQHQPTHLCGPRLQDVEHFHGRCPSHPGDEHTKCKVGGQSVETVEAHPAEASDTVTLVTATVPQQTL